MSTVFSVIFTTYEDDYKHRYDNGVYPESPILFSTKKKAFECINNRMIRELEEFVNNHISDDRYSEYFTDIDKHYNVKEKYKTTKELNKLVDLILRGEFVDTKFTYDLEKVKIE